MPTQELGFELVEESVLDRVRLETAEALVRYQLPAEFKVGREANAVRIVFSYRDWRYTFLVDRSMISQWDRTRYDVNNCVRVFCRQLEDQRMLPL